MSIEISLVQKDKNGNDRRVEKSFDNAQEAANWYEKQPKIQSKGKRKPNPSKTKELSSKE